MLNELVCQVVTLYLKSMRGSDTAIPNQFFTPPLAGDSNQLV